MHSSKRFLSLAALSLVSVFAHTHEWAFRGDGVLDLNLIDCRKPVALDLKQEPGHFVRVMLPKGFSTEKLSLTASSGVDAYPRLGGNRDAFDLAGSLFLQGNREVIAIQNGQGDSIVLAIHTSGRVLAKDEALEFLQFQADYQAKTRRAFPDDAGADLMPAKPVVRLRNPILSRCLEIDKMENRNGGNTAFTLKNDVQCQDEKGPVVLPTGTRLVGRVLFDPQGEDGKNTIDVARAIYPDGQIRETEGVVTVTGTTLDLDWP